MVGLGAIAGIPRGSAVFTGRGKRSSFVGRVALPRRWAGVVYFYSGYHVPGHVHTTERKECRSKGTRPGRAGLPERSGQRDRPRYGQWR